MRVRVVTSAQTRTQMPVRSCVLPVNPFLSPAASTQDAARNPRDARANAAANNFMLAKTQ
jgi:hypothetical protein